MIISPRSKGLWAATIVALCGITPVPVLVQGQIVELAQASATTPGETPELAAQRALLQARQSLAYSNVEAAKTFVNAARQTGADFTKVGDSPASLDAMIQRQEELVKLSSSLSVEDPSFDPQAAASFNSQAATFLLLQADAIMAYQDFETAERLIQQASQFKVEFNSATGTPAQMLERLQAAKTQGGKQQVLSLLAQAQLAMDQNRWNDANQLVQQAKQLNVDDTRFAANEPRAWQLELKIQHALNRQSASSSFSGVEPASFDNATAGQSADSANQVVQAGYDPATDKTRVVQVSAMEEIASPKPGSGMESYQSGLKALAENNRTMAIHHFQDAWQNREGLDGSIRLAIKSHLERLDPDSEFLKATLASQETDIGLDSAKADQRHEFSELQREIFRERSAADKLLETNKPREALTRIQSVRAKVTQSALDSESQRQLLTLVDRDIAEMQDYINKNQSEIMNDEANADSLERIDTMRQQRIEVETQLQKLVDNYNQLIKERRFEEAGVIVNQARSIAPDSEVVALLAEKHRTHSNLELALELKERRQQGFVDALRNTERAAIAMNDQTPIQFAEDLADYTRKRDLRQNWLNQSQYNSPAEARIFNLLDSERVQGEYQGSLENVINQLSEQTGENIIFDDLALAAESISREHPINLPIRQPITLKSALELILGQAGLVYVVEHEVIKVTSKDAQSSRLVSKTYYIGDLVMPMGQNPDPMRLRFVQPGVNPAHNGGAFAVQDQGANNLLNLGAQLGHNDPQSPFYGRGYQGGPQSGVPTYMEMGRDRFGGITANDYIPLIDLITNTINTDKWQDNGGTFSIQSFPQNLSLIVSASQDVHDQIQDLMKKLRDLNDVQIVIELRFLTLNDTFFEKIGIDFDFSINDDSGIPLGVGIGDRTPGSRSRVVGRQPLDAGQLVPTPDLDLRFTQGNFSTAVPSFAGAFDPGTAGNFGFAILSDIEVYFLIQAAKQDTRTIITQAPTVTMFNGQGASIFDGQQRPFVTSVVPVVGDFAVAHQPIITLLPEGTSLNVQAVVSNDRRFVTLNMVPMFSQISSVTQFTFDGSTTTRRTQESILDQLLSQINPDRPSNPDNEDFETVTSGVTIQLPVIASTNISTVVSVPDGGTVLLGGIKRMSEGRNESGLPILSNIPYINRLFRNTAIGHTTSNLMMMVTPRIIIQKEIEEDTVGLSGN